MEALNRYALAFPARDAFYIGLSSSFYDNFKVFRDLYDDASQFIGEDLHKISYIEPDKKPDLHMVCLITHCLGIYNVLMQYIPRPLSSMGFSQGEFTAIASAGGLKFPKVLELVYRLESMIVCDRDVTAGKMSRVVELEREKLKECCLQVDPDEQYAVISAYLSHDQNIISGRQKEVDMISKLAKSSGARWVLPLSGGGAFHSPVCKNLMLESAAVFDQYYYYDTAYPVYSCVTGLPTTESSCIKAAISKQVANPILWDKIVMDLKSKDVVNILELGPGCTVSGNTRIIDSDVRCNWINDVRGLENLIKSV